MSFSCIGLAYTKYIEGRLYPYIYVRGRPVCIIPHSKDIEGGL